MTIWCIRYLCSICFLERKKKNKKFFFVDKKNIHSFFCFFFSFSYVVFPFVFFWIVFFFISLLVVFAFQIKGVGRGLVIPFFLLFPTRDFGWIYGVRLIFTNGKNKKTSQDPFDLIKAELGVFE